jgi:hypothetical protein
LDSLAGWALPVLAVGLLALITLLFALFVGKWIDAQSNTVVSKPRAPRPKRSKQQGDAP